MMSSFRLQPTLPVLLLGTLLLATGGCSASPQTTYTSDGPCLAMADALQTLRLGDELPRVIEVLGKPTRTYRVRATAFRGNAYDVLAYDTHGSACSRILLDSPKELHLMFNQQGRLVSMGNKTYLGLQKATDVNMQRIEFKAKASR